MKTLNDVKQDYDNKEYTPKSAYPTDSYLREDAVIDEEQSVRWNREEVQRRNQQLRDARSAYRDLERVLEGQLRADAIIAISDEYSMSREAAALVWDHAYREKHAHMCDVWGYAEELAELTQKVLKTYLQMPSNLV